MMTGKWNISNTEWLNWYANLPLLHIGFNRYFRDNCDETKLNITMGNKYDLNHKGQNHKPKKMNTVALFSIKVDVQL